MPPNHWVFLERHVDDAAAQQERERQAEFQEQITRDQETSSGGNPPSIEEQPLPAIDALPPDQTQTP